MTTSMIPIPRRPLDVRPATMGDLAFVDALQKRHTHMVGWMPTKQLEGKINAGHVLLATDNSQLATPLGYCIGHDQYFKRDDVGIIYQMNVVPQQQRALVGATLVKAMFDRAAYGCKLFCCWCAQDIEANHFWESLGFVPLAFRAGSRGKRRVHIFWQRRIRADDTTTPYWFPSQTSSGSIREDRLVLPIPPGKLWSDEMPVILPGHAQKPALECSPGDSLKPRQIGKRVAALRRSLNLISEGGMRFGPASPPQPQARLDKKPRERKPKVKNDPRLVAAARELRDRYLEHVNAGGEMLTSRGKYDVSRLLVVEPTPLPLLPAA